MSEHRLVTDAEAGAAGHQNYPISIEETMRRLLATRKACIEVFEKDHWVRFADYHVSESCDVCALLAELHGERP